MSRGGGHPVDVTSRIEQALVGALGHCERDGNPPGLAAAMRHAVFPGGARVRPRLCLAVAAACGDGYPQLADSAAAAIELLHCASLVHDDLPCFDNAVMRRGRASVHAAFGERLAVLAGDAPHRPGVRDHCARGRAHPTAAAPLLLTIVARGRRAARASSRARRGSASRGVAGAVPPGQDRLAVRRRDRRWRDRRRCRPSRLAPVWATGWARPTRSPTTSATWPASRPRPASRWAAIAVLGRPNAARELGLAGAIR